MERTTQTHSHFERVSPLGCGGLVVVVVAAAFWVEEKEIEREHRN